MIDLCFTCLSVDRNVSSFHDFEFKNVFMDWFEDYETENLNICWECEALFRRMDKFKSQVLQAQNVMADWNKYSVILHKPTDTLSKLSAHTKAKYDIIYQEIKVEVDSESDMDKFEQDTDYLLPDMDYIEPEMENIEPDTDDIEPEMNNIESDTDYKEPDTDFIEPDTEKIEPDTDYIEPDTDYIEPDTDYIEPDPDNADTLELQTEDATEYNSSKILSKASKPKAKSKILPMPAVILKKEKKMVAKRKSKRSSSQSWSTSNPDVHTVVTKDGKLLKLVKKITNPSFAVVDSGIRRLDRNFLKNGEKNFLVLRVNKEQMLKSREEDRKHMKSKLYKFECEKCLIGYYNEDLYNNHLMKKHEANIGEYKCSICDTYVVRKDLLSYHMDCHYRTYKCKLCDFGHHRLGTMLSHYTRTHDKDATFPCCICDKVFKTHRACRYHREITHRKKLNLQCERCDKVFDSKIQLYNHVNAVHIHVGGHYPCPICDKVYTRLHSLKAHKNVAHSEKHLNKTTYCIKCDKQFKCHASYKVHIFEHKNHLLPENLKYECEFCNHKFVKKVYYKRHVMKVHEGTSPRHGCPHCDKSYANQPSLKKHIMQVHDHIPVPRNHLCSYCAKGFSTEAELRRHIRVHTGERPYQCELCSMTFKQQSTLGTHIKLKHKRTDIKLPGSPKRI